MNKKIKTQIAIIGLGAAGGVLFGKLAENGIDVTAIEAGPFWDTGKDFLSDERAMEKERWRDPRISLGKDPLDIGSGISGKGVGGGTVHYTMMSLRFHPSDFRVKSQDGVAVDWPISYDDLEPYYDELEKDLPVSGPADFPWGPKKKPYPMREHRLSCMDNKFKEGAQKLGANVVSCPLALITEPLAGRRPCINRGFCEQGCKPKAKSSTLITYVPRGVKAGGKVISEAMATKINLDSSGKKIIGVTYIKDGAERKLECDTLIICAFAVETPRLLLNNRSSKNPNGLANSSGAVGKYLMPHADHVVFAKFNEPLRVYRNPPTTSICQDFYETDPSNDFVRGYSVAPYSGRPIGAALTAISGRSELWGEKLRDFMKEYNFWMQLGMIGEVLPYEHNKAELSEEKDDYGLPIPKITFSLGGNEEKMISHAYNKMEEIMMAAGALETFRAPLFVHLMGTTRMGNDPENSVVDRNLKAHDIDNLYICGTQVFPTGAAVNPTLTTEALAARLADHLAQTIGRRNRL